ncbi:unnamed protein product [Polarella glacialis]|uniref:Uncharacterized protein n=1 Tax=Polarella glacialis TaxID=89957 RepID=A0A813L9T7_POLGL|nr:unnamed protein product [Polarella glacialis]|mmetsp:Transcript_83977/g.151532  ORF Transcript_83977/g.151532 Transcript_83977/m.151532 type:complete len:159 (-) Transcript_83977:101-577(-)
MAQRNILMRSCPATQATCVSVSGRQTPAPLARHEADEEEDKEEEEEDGEYQGFSQWEGVGDNRYPTPPYGLWAAAAAAFAVGALVLLSFAFGLMCEAPELFVEEVADGVPIEVTSGRSWKAAALQVSARIVAVACLSFAGGVGLSSVQPLHFAVLVAF